MKGDGTVFQRSDGKWCAELDVTDGHQNRVRPRRIRDTKQAARDALAELKAEHATGAAPKRLDAFLEGWLTDGPWKAKTLRSYTQVVNQHITPYLGKLKLSELSALRLQEWVTELKHGGRTNNTIRYARTVLRSALGDAQRLELLGNNPARLVEPPPHTKRKPKHFSWEQLDRLLRHSDGWLGCWIYVAAALTLRRGECLGLQWPDLDHRAGLIRIERQIGEDVQPDTLKTDGSRRELKASESVWLVLETQRRRVAAEFAGKPMPIWVWPNEAGNAMDPAKLEREFAKAREAAGLAEFRIHDLRATGIGRILAFRPLKDAQEHAGHDDGRTTVGYDKMTPDRQMATARILHLAFPLPAGVSEVEPEDDGVMLGLA